MRAVVVEEPGGSLDVVDDVLIEQPRHGEVLVRIAYCGVCHSDLSAQHSPFLPTQRCSATKLQVTSRPWVRGSSRARRATLSWCP